MEQFESEKIANFSEAIQSLELDKVLELVARRALSQRAADRLLSLPILNDSNEICLELEKVSAYRGMLDSGEDLPLEPLDDLNQIFKALEVAGAILAAENLVELARLARIARHVREFLQERQETFRRLWELAESIRSVRALEKEVEKAIDVATFEILDSASPALKRIRRSIESAHQAVRSKLQQILRQTASKEMLQEKLITVRDGRLVLMVKDEHKRKIKGIIHDQSATGQTLFIEPVETVDLNNRVRQLQVEERNEIERILARLSQLAGEHVDALRMDYQRLLALDMIRAKAVYSRDILAEAPQVKKNGVLTLYSARHPLLLEKYQDREPVVPLNLHLGTDFITLIITGPNAGGKTVAMKTAGLLVLMTRAGLHIPASPDSEIGLMGNLFVDIGDQQSIENDLSTFTSHMIRLQDMLRNAKAQDLVLVDEMGSGTDPEEGIPLALAVLQRLNQRGVRTIVTTHHGALKIFAHNTVGIENGSMVFDVETLRPTYEFRHGIPGASYAFEIAARVGLEQAVVAAARKQVGAQKGRLEQLISDLERKIQQQDELIRQLKLEETRLKGLIKLYQDRSEELAASKRKLKQQAIEESEAILARANAAVEQAVREIREKQAAKEAIRASKATLEREKQALQQERDKIENKRLLSKEKSAVKAPAEKIHPGMTVLWQPQKTQATVLNDPDAENRVFVQAGPLRVRVPVEELRIVASGKKQPATTVKVSAVTPVAQEIDLRGMRAEEAISLTDQYLSEALLYGWDEVRIIHGKGTGALRKAITEFLRSHPNVARFEPAPLGMGDLGVTVVRFK